MLSWVLRDQQMSKGGLFALFFERLLGFFVFTHHLVPPLLPIRRIEDQSSIIIYPKLLLPNQKQYQVE